MKKQTSQQLRDTFTAFFKKCGHMPVKSASLVPNNDRSLLFVNAGMVPFKDFFLGKKIPDNKRATSIQRCVRAGGKHNDLEQVGHTARHHTFFEMLGNFSFGDYFKIDAITLAWQFLTEELEIPVERLWVTVYEADQETADIWLNDMKISPDRFSYCGEKDNFWAMGDTGPCGPCTEIFYDHGEKIVGGPPGSANQDGDRYTEIWNLVFMQYDRLSNGDLQPLPKPSVDTGMGLERLTAVMQGVHNNFDTDLFIPILQAIAKKIGADNYQHTGMRVIADHLRSSAFLLMDGVIPSNEGRGYVLRRIIRRAARYGNQLGLYEPFLFELLPVFVREMRTAYPELVTASATIATLLEREEQQFAKTLEQGLAIFEQEIKKMTGKVLSGDVVFRLYDTYGFPPDLTEDISRERELAIDWSGFQNAMAEQRKQSKQSSQFAIDYQQTTETLSHKTRFSGYETLQLETCVNALLCDGKSVEQLHAGQQGSLILEQTPFYAESGGQVGDQGEIRWENAMFQVRDTQWQQQAIVHHGVLMAGTLKARQKIIATVDQNIRQATMLNHSATHLLHATLRELLGTHVTQRGSSVDADRLRFDFSHFNAVTPIQLEAIEASVNRAIRTNVMVKTHLMAPEQAIAAGAMALFGEKYDDQVRVLTMGNFSKELCGGTHVRYTGDIGLFKIISESGIAAGIRRIEAITGEAAIEWLQQQQQHQQALADLLKATPTTLYRKAQQWQQQMRDQEQQIQRLQQKLTQGRGANLAESAKKIGNAYLLVQTIEDTDANALRQMIDQLKHDLGSGIILLATIDSKGKVLLTCGVTADQCKRVAAGELINYVATHVGGKGGGRPDFAQAGGTKPDQLSSALDLVENWVKERLL
jgi:alanyl-tRNA synthetase